MTVGSLQFIVLTALSYTFKKRFSNETLFSFIPTSFMINRMVCFTPMLTFVATINYCKYDDTKSLAGRCFADT